MNPAEGAFAAAPKALTAFARFAYPDEIAAGFATHSTTLHGASDRSVGD
jgi:hypothetical protein